MVGHQRGRPRAERVGDGPRKLGRAEPGVGRDRHRAAEPRHLVVHGRHLLDDRAQGAGHRRVRVHDGGDVRAAVELEVQVELGGRLAAVRSLDRRAVEVDDHHRVALDRGQARTGGGDRHAVAVAHGEVPGASRDEPGRGEFAAGRDQRGALDLEGSHRRQGGIRDHPAMTTVREATLDALRARGMTTIFGNPGLDRAAHARRLPRRLLLRARPAGVGRRRRGRRLRPGVGAPGARQPPHGARRRQRRWARSSTPRPTRRRS